MSYFRTAPPARLFTAFGTVLYVDAASGQLRHGEAATSPENTFFVPDQRTAEPQRQGRLISDSGASRDPIALLADRHLSASRDNIGQDTPFSLELIPLERGLIGLRAKDHFLSAIPNGDVMLSAQKCSTWELFLASEDWCSEASPSHDQPSLVDPASDAFDQRAIKTYVVHPLIRVRASTKAKNKKVLIYGYPKWSHGRVYYDLCKHLYRRGYIVDILDWQVNHAHYIQEIIPYYDLFMAACDGVRTLVDSYGVSYEKIIALSHHEFDIRMLIEQKGIEVFNRFANYGVVSEFVYCASLMRGVTRVPMVTSLGINYSEFFTDISSKLETVGYASSMSVKTYGIEWKRGDLVEAAAREAGLAFKVAGWTGAQTSFHDMPDFYKTVDAVVTSSISEAAQLPVMEAAAAGRLVIGTPVGHFPRKAYEGGGIIAPIEAEKFKAFTVTKLEYYKECPSIYVSKCRSIQAAAQKFDWQHSIGEWVQLIETAGADSSRQRAQQATAPTSFRPKRFKNIQFQHDAESSVEQSVLAHLNLEEKFASLKECGYSQPTKLCRVMSSFGSDKGGLYHNYTVVYDHLFSEFRTEELEIFELGLGTNKIGAPSTMGPSGKPGASLRGWREYFEKSLIYGADIDRGILFTEDRIRTFWVDQRDKDAIRALWEELGKTSFDIMIDDGLHESSANICFFMESFGRLKSGGLYIVEDIKQDDVSAMEEFAASVSLASKHVVYELLEHPRNKFDNRLLIIQKK